MVPRPQQPSGLDRGIRSGYRATLARVSIRQPCDSHICPYALDLHRVLIRQLIRHANAVQDVHRVCFANRIG
jgi:hypothetical protein